MVRSSWASAPLRERLAIVRGTRHLLAARAAEIAAVLSAGGGLSRARALVAEVLPLLDACRFLEREAPRLLAPRRAGRRGRPFWLSGVDLEVRRRPWGVVLVVGASNYPLLLPGVQVVQALAAGNAVVLKPGKGGTEAARCLRKALLDAGLDPALVRLLPESPATIPGGVDKVFLTGSAATGKAVLAELSGRVVPATLELSGCDCLVVRPEADLDLVTKAVVFGVTLNAGATCVAPRRIFATRDVAEELENRLTAAFRALPPVRVEPERMAQLESLLDDAVRHGARLPASGFDGNGQMRPVLVAAARPDMRLLKSDVFAPVTSIVEVENDQAVLEADGHCPYALGAAVFGDEGPARSLAARLRAGVVVVNDLIVPTADPRLPFGGRDRSGFGVTRGAEGLLEMTTIQAIAVRRRGRAEHLDVETPADEGLFRAAIELAHGRGFGRRSGALWKLLGNLLRRARASGTRENKRVTEQKGNADGR